MHLSNNQSEKVSRLPLSSVRGLVTAIALSTTACVSPQNNHSPTPHIIQTTECDVDDPVFIALVSISAEVQASMERPENRSLGFVWRTVSERLQEMHLKNDVSVSLCSPVNTERGYAYILINVAGQQMQVFAKDKQTAENRTKDIQESYITYIADRMRLLLGENPATQDALQVILQDEEKILAKHRMIAKIQQDNSKTWTISFEAEI